MNELPKFVLRRLGAGAAPAEHPPADLLAAFVEQQLAGAERENLLAHLAGCEQCRSVVWCAMPEVEMAQPEPVPAVPHWSLAWRWAGVAAGVAVLAGVALLFRGGPGPAGENVASAPNAPVVTAKRDAQSLSANAPAPAPPRGRLKTRPAVPPKAQLEAKAAPILKSAPPTGEQASAGQIAPAGKAAQSADAISAASPARLPAPPAAKAEALATNSATAPAAYPLPASTAEPGVMVGSAISSLALGKKKLAPPTLWMLSPDGHLLRSTDSGKNWQAVPFDGKVFRAVAVVGPKVWVGGLGGTLYYSSDDGSQWTRLAPSDNVRLNEDVRALIFQDGRHGNLTTASGQSWATSDGGHSWRKQ